MKILFISCLIVIGIILPRRVSCQDYKEIPVGAAAYFSEGYYSKAAELYYKWFNEVKAPKNESDTLYQNTLVSAGSCFYSAGQYEKALRAYEKLQSIHLDEKRADSIKIASDINDIADCYYSMGKYNVSLPLYRQSLNIRLRFLGSVHPDYAESLENIGVLYCDQGKYEQALPLLEQAKQIKQDALGTENLEFAKSLDNLGTYYYSVGNYKAALPLFEQAAGIKLKISGSRHPAYAKSLNSMAALNYSMGKYDKALPLYLEATAIDREKLGNRNLDYGIDLNNTAMLYKKMGNYQAALPLLKEFSSICEETVGITHPSYASSLMNLGSIYSSLGDYDTSIVYFEKAREIRRAQLGTNHADYARVLNNLAMVYKKVCNYETALSLYKEALSIYLDVFGRKHVEYSRTLNNLALLYVTLGNYDAALPLYEEAIELNKPETGARQQDYAIALNNLGQLYSDMGNYWEAIRLLTEAARIDSIVLGAKHPDYATDLINLANQYSGAGKYQEAMAMEKEASSVFLEKFGDKHLKYALSLSSMGRLYKSMGNYDAALPLFVQAVAIYKEAVGIKNVDYAMSLKNLAVNYKEMGNYNAALPLLEEASAIYKELYGTGHSDYNYCLQRIAEIYIANGNFKLALPLMDEVNASMRQHIRDYFSFLPEAEKKLYLAKVDDFYDHYLSCIIQAQSSSPGSCSGGYDNELFLKGIILSSVTSMQQSILESGDSALIDEYEQMRVLKRQINIWQQKPVSERKTDITATEQHSAELEKDLTRRSHVFSEMQQSLDVRWVDVSKQLKEKQAAVEFVNFRFYDHEQKTDSIFYCALVLRYNDTLPQMSYLCEESQLRSVLPSNKAAFRDINAFYQGKAIYNLVWEPLDSLLTGISTVYYAPSGLLNHISLAAISDLSGTELFRKFKLVQLSSTRTLALSRKPESIKTAVVYGGIIYDTDSLTLQQKSGKYPRKERISLAQTRSDNHNARNGFGYLPGTLKEAGIVAAKLGKYSVTVNSITGTDAIEESFIALSGADAPSVIHLSTHGFYYPEPASDINREQLLAPSTGETRFRYSTDPLLRSGLLMAGANLAWKGLPGPPDAEDGILTAKEVSNMNLMRTHLVVLSACQTGQGDVKGSEGVEGLQRGFKMAGVRYIIMSLWEVPDKETTEFMENFYQKWLDGTDIRDAFRETQSVMSAKYRNEPFKWAAFVLVE